MALSCPGNDRRLGTDRRRRPQSSAEAAFCPDRTLSRSVDTKALDMGRMHHDDGELPRDAHGNRRVQSGDRSFGGQELFDGTLKAVRPGGPVTARQKLFEPVSDRHRLRLTSSKKCGPVLNAPPLILAQKKRPEGRLFPSLAGGYRAAPACGPKWPLGMGLRLAAMTSSTVAG